MSTNENERGTEEKLCPICDHPLDVHGEKTPSGYVVSGPCEECWCRWRLEGQTKGWLD